MDETVARTLTFLRELENDITAEVPPMFLKNYTLLPEEVNVEISDWILNYLEQRKCPHLLALYLTRSVVAQFQSSCEFRAQNEGLDPSVVFHSALKELKEVINQILQQSSAELELRSVAERGEVLPFDVSVFAIKNKRRKMEDRHVIIRDLNMLMGLKNVPSHSYYAVFDGHAGVDAASYAAAHLHVNLVEHPDFLTDTSTAIREAFMLTDSNFCKKANTDGIKSGCTAVVALIRDRTLYLAWLGDSQALLIDKGSPVTIMTPHKPNRPDEKERIERLGGFVHHVGTWRVNGTLAVSRALGDHEFKPFVSGEPDMNIVSLKGSEDFLILACDGLWDGMSPTDVAPMVYSNLKESSSSVSPDVIAEKLVQQSKQQGSDDNITVVVVFLRSIEDILADTENNISRLQQISNTSAVFPSLEGDHPERPRVLENIISFPSLCPGSQKMYSSEKIEPIDSTDFSELPTPPIDDINNHFSNYCTQNQISEIKPDVKDLLEGMDSLNINEQKCSHIGTADDLLVFETSVDGSDVNSQSIKCIIDESVSEICASISTTVSDTVELVSELSSESGTTFKELNPNAEPFIPKVHSSSSSVVIETVMMDDAATESDVNNSSPPAHLESSIAVESVVESMTIAGVSDIVNEKNQSLEPIESKDSIAGFVENKVQPLAIGEQNGSAVQILENSDLMHESLQAPLEMEPSESEDCMASSVENKGHSLSSDEHGDFAEETFKGCDLMNKSLQAPLEVKPLELDAASFAVNDQSTAVDEQVGFDEETSKESSLHELLQASIEVSRDEIVNPSRTDHEQKSGDSLPVQEDELFKSVTRNSGVDDEGKRELSVAKEIIHLETLVTESAIAVDLQSVPDCIPEAEGVCEDVDSDSEKDGGWSYMKAASNDVNSIVQPSDVKSTPGVKKADILGQTKSGSNKINKAMVSKQKFLPNAAKSKKPDADKTALPTKGLPASSKISSKISSLKTGVAPPAAQGMSRARQTAVAAPSTGRVLSKTSGSLKSDTTVKGVVKSSDATSKKEISSRNTLRPAGSLKKESSTKAPPKPVVTLTASKIQVSSTQRTTGPVPKGISSLSSKPDAARSQRSPLVNKPTASPSGLKAINTSIVTKPGISGAVQKIGAAQRFIQASSKSSSLGSRSAATKLNNPSCSGEIKTSTKRVDVKKPEAKETKNSVNKQLLARKAVSTNVVVKTVAPTPKGSSGNKRAMTNCNSSPVNKTPVSLSKKKIGSQLENPKKHEGVKSSSKIQEGILSSEIISQKDESLLDTNEKVCKTPEKFNLECDVKEAQQSNDNFQQLIEVNSHAEEAKNEYAEAVAAEELQLN